MNKYFKKVWKLATLDMGLVAFTALANILVLNVFDNVAEQFFGSTPDYLIGSDKGQNVEYVKSSFDSVEELYQYEKDKCAEIAQDGLTLLKNDDNLLPLSTDTTFLIVSTNNIAGKTTNEIVSAKESISIPNCFS